MAGRIARQITVRTRAGSPAGLHPPLELVVCGADVSTGDSLAALFSTNRAMILRYFRAQGAGDHAEDLLQELWLKIQRAPSVSEVSRAYLMKMAHNLILDEARSAMRRKQRDRAWQTDGPAGVEIDPSPDAEQVLISRESLGRVEGALRLLGSRTETILRRHRIDGVAQKDLAREQGLSLSAIEKHLQKAYRSIALVQIEVDGSKDIR